ncbi:alpha-methylacyl-CoA racemase [Venturia nashicola]|uniref:Alpha-methylacyl-CoA racemase n=1 Tax=Venturia nashicola TaxID=86259 RepID=A0A4Z1P7Y2_9PEZI|nr:alpha-methylacyl-CoA racemase [Venturia nashicola]TLD35745.1 alpha-methylacyl-CoA racemase [Venturia nashicola]
MTSPPPLAGIRVLELAGLAPGPFAGVMLADYGATVLRLDRATPGAHTSSPPSATPDVLSRRKTSIAVDMKSTAGLALIKSLLPHVDVVIDPFRPGVLEKLGLGPEQVMLKINPRIIVARMTGFRRDGKYKDMAGHDINYIAVSGVLSMLGRVHEKPFAPGNILGDFAGGGAMCFLGILLALIGREKTGRGQVVEANMVDGASYLATMPRLSTKRSNWSGPRGTNMLDGGCPYYDTYETKDGRFMAVGALEPQFFAQLVKGLSLPTTPEIKNRLDPSSWPVLKSTFTNTFLSKTRAEWESIFDGTDACVTPVLTQIELEKNGFDQRVPVTLRSSPGLALADGAIEEKDVAVRSAKGQGMGVKGQGWDEKGLSPGMGGEKVLGQWLGWRRGRQFDVVNGGLVKREEGKL